METGRIMRIAIIGAGNVASHLADILSEKGHKIEAVVSKSGKSAELIALKTGGMASDDISRLPSGLDLIIISVTDAAVSDVAVQLPVTDAIVAHTSGSIPLDVLSHHPRRGVFYPLQTFSKDVDVKMKDVPFFIESADTGTLEELESLAREISPKVFRADSATRAKLHIAGVLSSNFPIYLLEMARQILAEAGLPLDTVRPLAEATVSKAFTTSPLDALTGPARRGDISVIRRQSATFSNPLEKAVYDSLSNAILARCGHKTF